MPQPKLFLSYSRRELYFAEAVVHALQERGLNIWFDLQQLEPGSRWKAEIARGLDASDGLILIASRNSLQSPWVGQEWQTAKKQGKPIYILLFEAVSFEPMDIPIEEDETMRLDLPALLDYATIIIDGRSVFQQSVTRFAEAILEGTPQRDAIPQPNFLKLPTRMPLAIAAVAIVLVLLIVGLTHTTVTALPAYPPMVAAGVMGIMFVVWVLWAFLQRRNYRTTRQVLVVSPFIALFFQLWLVPFAIIGAGIALTSPDIHRWSPLGQGLQSRRGGEWGGTHRSGDWIVYLMLILLFFLAYEILLCLPILLVSFLAWRVSTRPSRRKRHRWKGKISGYSYRVSASPSDYYISQDVIQAMDSAGHNLIDSQKSDKKADYHLIVLTEHIHYSTLQDIDLDDEKIIVVVGSAVQPNQNTAPFGNFQWVDYRQQDLDRLYAMADDLRTPQDVQSINSFSTRIVPQNFSEVLLPRRVAFYIGLQLLAFNIFVIFTVRDMVLNPNPLLLIATVLNVIYWIISIWIVNRVITREITIPHMHHTLIAAYYVLFGIFILGNVGSVMSFNPGGGILVLGISLVAVYASYRLGRFILRITLGWWLPVAVAPHIGLSPSDDSVRWLRTLSTAIVIGLLTLGFLGQQIPILMEYRSPEDVEYRRETAQTISFEVPTDWFELPPGAEGPEPYLSNVPISAILLRANSPLAPSAAVFINEAYSVGPTISLFLAVLGPEIGPIFDEIIWGLDGGRPWEFEPEQYGRQLDYRLYRTEDAPDDLLNFYLFEVSASGHSLPADIRDAIRESGYWTMQQQDRNVLSDGVLYDFTFRQMEEYLGNYSERGEETNFSQYRVGYIDLEGQDYFFVIVGSQEVIADRAPVLRYIFESVRVRE